MENKNLEENINLLNKKNQIISSEIIALNSVLRSNLEEMQKIDKEKKEKLKEREIGFKDGKQNTSFLWVFCSLLHLFGVILVEMKKIEYPENKSDFYLSGYKQGVKKRRYLYYFLSLLFGTILFEIVLIKFGN